MLLLLLGCAEFFAVKFAPARVPEVSEAEDAVAARAAFWTMFGDNRILDLPSVTAQLTAAYLGHPQDPTLARLLGHAHFLWFVERERLGPSDATITDHAVLSEHYFAQAALLDPEDHRIHAWWGGSQLVVAQLRGDDADQRRGYFETMRGVEGYPAYNLVTTAFIFGLPPKDSPAFPTALASIWGAIDQCAGTEVDRDHFEVASFRDRSPRPPRDAGEVCWNDPERYPFNQQGIVLQLGELLLKAGETERARQVYSQLAETEGFEDWPLKHLAQDRLDHLDAYAARWNTDTPPPYLLTSGHSCTVCHARQATPTPPPEVDPG